MNENEKPIRHRPGDEDHLPPIEQNQGFEMADPNLKVYELISPGDANLYIAAYTNIEAIGILYMVADLSMSSLDKEHRLIVIPKAIWNQTLIDKVAPLTESEILFYTEPCNCPSCKAILSAPMELNLYELRYFEGTKEWISAYTEMEALIILSQHSGITILDLDDRDEMVSIPPEEWDTMFIYDDPDDYESQDGIKETFADFMGRNRTPEYIATTVQ